MIRVIIELVFCKVVHSPILLNETLQKHLKYVNMQSGETLNFSLNKDALNFH